MCHSYIVHRSLYPVPKGLALISDNEPGWGVLAWLRAPPLLCAEGSVQWHGCQALQASPLTSWSTSAAAWWGGRFFLPSDREEAEN